MMRRLAVSAVLALAVLACRGRSSPSPSPSPSLPPEAPETVAAFRPLPEPLPVVIAKVNGRPIPLNHAILIAERLMGPGPATPETRANAYRAAMEQLIARELLFQEAVARRINPDSAAVERAHDQVRGQYKTEKEWLDFLKVQGLDPQAFKTELRTRHAVEALVREEAGRVPSELPESEIKAYYAGNPSQFQVGDRAKVSHILIRVPPPGDAAAKAGARAKAEKVLARIKKGEDFGRVASEVSEDQGSAPQGGLLDPFTRGVMAPPFEEAAFTLKPGELSTVVETQFGYHILLVHERQPPFTEPLERAHDRIRDQLVAAKRQNAINALLSGLRARGQVETFL